MINKKQSIFEGINNFGLGIYIMTIGAVSYLVIRGLKKLLDLLCESLLEKYFAWMRKAVDEYMIPLREKIERIENNQKTEKERNHDAIAKNEGVLNLALEKLDEYDKKLDEKTIINIPTTKHKS